MQEFSLGEILQGLREKFSRGVVVKEKIATCLSSVLGYTVSTETISVKGKTLFVTLPPVVKNELFMRKKQCLESLQQASIFIDDIR